MKRIAFALLAIISLASCSTIKYISDDVAIPLPSSVAIAEPLVNIGIIEKMGKMEFSDSLTALAVGSTEFALRENEEFSPVSSIIPVSDEQYGDLFSAVEFLARADLKKKELRTMYVPEAILDFMEEHSLTQAGFLIETGFERTKDNFRKEILLDVAMSVVTAILSFGSVVSIPTTVSCSNEYSFIVVDAPSQKLLYRNTEGREAHPYDNSNSIALLRTLFRDYASSIR